MKAEDSYWEAVQALVGKLTFSVLSKMKAIFMICKTTLDSCML